MLKTVALSANRKTGPIAVTYRAGSLSTYGTCPTACALHPRPDEGAATIDPDYLQALRFAVPRRGIAWTYSHFPAHMLPAPAAGETVINASADSIDAAVAATAIGRPATLAAPAGTEWPQKHQGVRFVRCPAETVDHVTCATCGGDRPLCARGDRDYVVVFVAHGAGAKRVGTGTGGCYAAGGPTAIQWHGTRKAGAANDADALRAFVAALPPGSMLRHHVAGDIGAELAL
jgi:hypothetical protein